MIDSSVAIADFVSGMRAGDFSRLAAAFEGAPSLVQVWDERGAFAGMPEIRAESLTSACFLGALSAAEYLLSHGVSPTAGIATGLNAFHWAANRGQLETVRLLLRRSAPLETRSSYDGTVLGTAVWAAVHEPRPTHPQVIEELLLAGARVEDGGYPSGDPQVDAILRRFGAVAA